MKPYRRLTTIIPATSSHLFLLPLLLLLSATCPITRGAAPDLDSLDFFEEPQGTFSAVVASEDTRLLQDVFEDLPENPLLTEEPMLVDDEEEELVVRQSTATLGPTTEVLDPEVVVEEPKPRIAYSHAYVNKTYLSKDNFNARGMEHLYLITNLFLDLVHREEEYPKQIRPVILEELNKVPPLNLELFFRVLSHMEGNWDVLLIHYIGLVALVFLGALLAVVMPLAGLVFACCRCAGRCGAQEPHYDKKRDPCKRVTLGTLLATLVVVILLGLVCAFVTNARAEEGIQEFPKDLNDAVHDTRIFLNNTDSEVQNLLVRNYRELQDVLFNKLDSSGELVKVELARVTKAGY